MKPIIRVENLSKQYRLGGERKPYSTFRETIIETIQKPLKGLRSKDSENSFWALREVNFEVSPGEVVGIIGRNGAGKSTLLKILSRITEPTRGKIELYGRVGSLLEVGTGFHPELTGRENIYLNGAILGMKQWEIGKKFEEIVEFAEVSEFLDTPVKHYSSGMYTRLAFAVAANLEPEVLIVDEVLAVGDAEFQKKCLGKMSEVAKHGRTVLFVSHNMAAVRSLCQRAIFLQKGELKFDSTAHETVDLYLKAGIESASEREWTENEMPGTDAVKIKRASVYAENKSAHEPILSDENVVLDIEFFNYLSDADIDVTWDLLDNQGVHVAHIGTICSTNGRMKRGLYHTTGIFPGKILNTKEYVLSVQFGRNQRELLYRMEDILSFEIESSLKLKGASFSRLPGAIHPQCEWQTVFEN